MACNTKHGPAAAIKCYEEATGIHLTQRDWHLIREEARLNSGGKLSREVISEDEARTVAADFYDAAHTGQVVDPAARDAFVTKFASQKNTAGTLHTIDEITQNGLPKAVLERSRKGVVSPAPVAPRPAPSDTLDSNGVMFLRGDMVGFDETSIARIDGHGIEELGRHSDVLGETFNDEDGVKAAVSVRSAADSYREVADQMGADLAQRMKDNGINEIRDEATGTTFTRHSGFRYKSWQHEAIQAELANSIAVADDYEVNEVASVMGAYNEYVTKPTGYRTSTLRDYGLRARDFAEGVEGTPSVAVSFADRADALHSRSSVNAVNKHPHVLALITEHVSDSRARAASLPLDEAVREYAAVRHNERALGRLANSVESDVATQMLDRGDSPVSVDGTSYIARTTAGGEKWDTESLDRILVPKVAEQTGVDGSKAHEIVRRYKEVAQIGGYRKKALKALGLDVDEYVTTTPGSRKVSPAAVDATVNA